MADKFRRRVVETVKRCGVEWDAHGSCRTDDGRDKLYVSFRAVGMIRKADGKLYPTAASYDLDLELVKEELEEMYLQKGKKDNKRGQALDDYIHYCVTRDWLHKRKHKLTLAESGAKARVIRNILGIQSQYSRKQDIVGKRFTMVRFVLDNQNPDIKQAMLAAARDNMSALYGPGAAPRYLPASSGDGEGDVIDLPTADDKEPDQPGTSDPGMDSTTVGFENSDIATQVATSKSFVPARSMTCRTFSPGQRRTVLSNSPQKNAVNSSFFSTPFKRKKP
jgi:hypothetical protein